ncbi:MAG: sugar ABC transporter permease [Propionicimonas sp.]
MSVKTRRPRQQRLRKRIRGVSLPYLLITPAGIMEMLVHVLPMLLGIWIAFVGLSQLTIADWTSAPFVGLRNFVHGLDPSGPIGSQFYATIGRTVLFTALVVALSWGMGMLGAFLLASKFRGNGLLRTVFLIPYALPVYVGTITWAFMFNQRDGMINSVLVDQLHLLDQKPFWLIGPNAFLVVVIATAWQYWPFAFLMLLASLQTIPDELYEAAALDGASIWRQFRAITLPMIRPTNLVLLLVLCLWVFNQFNVPYVLFGASSPEWATLISPLIYEQSFKNWNFGVGAAMSVLLLMALVAASLVYVRLTLHRGEEAS